MDDSETESEHYSDYDHETTPAPLPTHGSSSTDQALHIHTLNSGVASPEAALCLPKDGHDHHSGHSSFSAPFISPFASLAERQLETEAPIKHEPVAPSEALCTVCARCHSPLGRILATADTKVPHYCICCRRPLPVEFFSASEAKRRVVRRCLDCIKAGESSDPERLRSFAALVPESVRRAPLAESALRLMTEASRQLRAEGGPVVRLEDDARLKTLSVQVKKLAQDHQANRARQIDIMKRGGATLRDLEQVYGQWIALENTRWSLRRQQLDVYCELLARHGFCLPPQSRKRLQGAGVSPWALDVIKEQGEVPMSVAVEEPVKIEMEPPSITHSCSRCHATVTCVSSVEEVASALWCMCCQRPLPGKSFLPGQSPKNHLRRCVACMTVGSAADKSLGIRLVEEAPAVVRRGVTIDKALGEMKQMLTTQGLYEQGNDDPRVKSIAEREAYLIADRARNTTQLKELIRLGGVPDERFSDVYNEMMRIEETQYGLRLERIHVLCDILIERGGSFPENFRDVLASARVENELLRQIKWVPNQCEVCSATLVSTQETKAYPAFCDCCKRVIAHSVVAFSQKKPLFALCQVCSEARHLSSAPLCQESPRVGRNWIERLLSASKELEKFLRPTKLDFKGPHGLHQTALQAQVNTLKKRYLQLASRMKEAVNNKRTVMYCRELYMEHEGIEAELHPLLVQLVKYRLDTLSRRGGRLRESVKSITSKLYGEDGVPPNVQEMLDRPSLPDGDKPTKAKKRQHDQLDSSSHEDCQQRQRAVFQSPGDEVIRAFEKQTDETGLLTQRFLSATEKLKLTLVASGFGSFITSDSKLAALELDLERWRNKRNKSKSRRQNARDAEIEVLRSIAEARASINKELANIAKKMVRHLLVRCHEHGLKPPSSIEPVVALLQSSDEQQ